MSISLKSYENSNIAYNRGRYIAGSGRVQVRDKRVTLSRHRAELTLSSLSPNKREASMDSDEIFKVASLSYPTFVVNEIEL